MSSSGMRGSSSRAHLSSSLARLRWPSASLASPSGSDHAEVLKCACANWSCGAPGETGPAPLVTTKALSVSRSRYMAGGSADLSSATEARGVLTWLLLSLPGDRAGSMKESTVCVSHMASAACGSCIWRKAVERMTCCAPWMSVVRRTSPPIQTRQMTWRKCWSCVSVYSGVWLTTGSIKKKEAGTTAQSHGPHRARVSPRIRHARLVGLRFEPRPGLWHRTAQRRRPQ